MLKLIKNSDEIIMYNVHICPKKKWLYSKPNEHEMQVWNLYEM